MRRYILYISSFIVVLSTIGCQKESIPEASPPPQNLEPEFDETGGYVFTSNETSNFEIWKKEGYEVTQLTNDAAFDCWWPRYNGSSKKIIYYKSHQGRDVNDYSSANLWIMNADGSENKVLIEIGTHGWIQQGLADWSHSGDRIVMAAKDPEIGKWQVYITDQYGQNPIRVSLHDDIDYYDPVFGADDQFIYYVASPKEGSNPGSDTEIMQLSLSDSSEIRLTNNAYEDHHPHVSPDGQFIVYESLVDEEYLGIGKWSLMKLDLNTANEEVLLNDDQVNLMPRFSADGETIFYSRLNIETFAMNLATLSVNELNTKSLITKSYSTMNIDPY